jgi:hypothetical protein
MESPKLPGPATPLGTPAERPLATPDPPRTVMAARGRGLGTTRYLRGSRIMPERVIPQKRPAAAPIRTCLPASVNGWGLVVCPCGPPSWSLRLAPLRRGFSFWNQSPRSELFRCGRPQSHSAMSVHHVKPVHLGPASAGLCSCQSFQRTRHRVAPAPHSALFLRG